MALTERSKIKFGPGLILIGANLLALGVLTSGIFLLRSELNQLKESYRQLKFVRQQSVDLNKLRLLVVETAPARRTVNDYFVQTKNLAPFIERVEGLAARTDVSLDFTRAQVKDVNDGLPQAEFIFQASGPYDNFSRFLALFESLPLELRLRRAVMNYKSPTKAGSTGGWSGEFSIEVAGLPENYVGQD